MTGGSGWASIIVPAHNEETTIGRLLDGLAPPDTPDLPEIVVVCNACTDRTAEVARAYPVTVLEQPEPSKWLALKAGDRAAAAFPRFYVDADVELSLDDVRAMTTTLAQPGVLATAPRREIDTTAVTFPARLYYRAWEQLPEVRTGLFARGVVAVSAAGFERIAQLTETMADDLAMSSSFGLAERPVTPGAAVVVHPARTWRALVNRRLRVAAGNRSLRRAGASAPETRLADLVTIARGSVGQAVAVAWFLVTTVLVRLLTRWRRWRGRDTIWLRDESSRPPAAGGGRG